MFRTPTNYEYDPIPQVDSIEYRISPFDRIQFNLFTNDGYRLIDVVGQQQGGGGGGAQNIQAIRQFGLNYLVEADGQVKLPTLGRTQLAGLTIKEAEIMLEERYEEFYRKPFILIQVTNNRVIVSPGQGGVAQVVNINENMTVLEVLARSGGIATRGNASKIKVIRDVGDKKEVYNLDLSKIEGIYQCDMVVQANDIIYVQPNPEIARGILRDITPVVTLITTTILLTNLLSN